MPEGKPAFVRCVQLTDDNLCGIYDDPARPAVCGRLRPEAAICGGSREEALVLIGELERATQPVQRR